MRLECKRAAKPCGESAHEVRYLTIRFHGLALEPAAGPGPFPLEHRAKVQKFKKDRGYNANRPQAHIVALVVDGAGLLHLHKASLFEQGDSPLTTALADAGVTDDGLHVYVDKTIFQRGGSKAKRGKVKVGQDCFDNDLASLPALGTSFPVRVRLEQLAFLWMVVPRLCAFRCQREDARQSAFAFPDGSDRGKVGMLRVMAATVAGHISTPRG